MNHSTYILTELSQPVRLNRLITESSVNLAAKEAGKTLEEYLNHVKSGMKYVVGGRIKLNVNGGTNFYIFRRVD